MQDSELKDVLTKLTASAESARVGSRAQSSVTEAVTQGFQRVAALSTQVSEINETVVALASIPEAVKNARWARGIPPSPTCTSLWVVPGVLAAE